MKKTITISSTALIILLIVLLSCSKEEDPLITPSPKTLSEKVQIALNKAIVNYDGKGVSVAIILPDGELIKCASGISHDDVDITADMLFSAGSITKMFTAACILQYVEEGLISLDDSLYHWIDEHENIDGTISIRQLLNHTGGIFDIAANDDLWELLFSQPQVHLNMEEIIRDYTLPPYFAKGTSWHYSNTDYLILRVIMEKISQHKVSAEYRERLLDPYHLTNTFTAVDETLPLNTAYGWYDLNNDGRLNKIAPTYMQSFYSLAGGGIFCTSEDLAKWAKVLLADQSILGQEMMDEMLTMHSPCPGEEMITSYGLGIEGFNPALFNGNHIIGHGGDPVGYAAACLYLPDENFILSVMDNTEDGNVMWVINDIIELIVAYLDEE